jgi:hypothetical protein
MPWASDTVIRKGHPGEVVAGCEHSGVAEEGWIHGRGGIAAMVEGRGLMRPFA